MTDSTGMPKNWNKMMMKKFLRAKKCDEFKIVQKDDDKLDVFYVLLKTTGGHYKDQNHILEFKTKYGSYPNVYYFPLVPPNVTFITSIYHPNISKQGTICVDILKEKNKWSPQNSIETVMMNIIALLDYPNCASPYNTDASKLFSTCQKKYQDSIKILKYKKGNINRNVDNSEKIKLAYEESFASYDDKVKKYNYKLDFRRYHKYFPSLEQKNQEEKKEDTCDM